VTVTYCPLTGTAMGFERGETTFGVSGRLINSNLVMYDREAEAWWPQIAATSVPGPWNGDPDATSLNEFRAVWTTWGRWRELHPDTVVLSEETGYFKNYGYDPYGSYNPKKEYYAEPSTLFPSLSENDRFEPKRVVMGTRTTEGAAAFLKDAVREKGVLRGAVGGDPIVAVYDDRLDTAYVYHDPEGRSVSVDGATVVVDGCAYAPDAVPMERVYAFDAMWFAWSGFYPETNVYE